MDNSGESRRESVGVCLSPLVIARSDVTTMSADALMRAESIRSRLRGSGLIREPVIEPAARPVPLTRNAGVRCLTIESEGKAPQISGQSPAQELASATFSPSAPMVAFSTS
jgi:hypothetical protein